MRDLLYIFAILIINILRLDSRWDLRFLLTCPYDASAPACMNISCQSSPDKVTLYRLPSIRI